jgi:PAS domain S-box-containing protein
MELTRYNFTKLPWIVLAVSLTIWSVSFYTLIEMSEIAAQNRFELTSRKLVQEFEKQIEKALSGKFAAKSELIGKKTMTKSAARVSAPLAAIQASRKTYFKQTPGALGNGRKNGALSKNDILKIIQSPAILQTAMAVTSYSGDELEVAFYNPLLERGRDLEQSQSSQGTKTDSKYKTKDLAPFQGSTEMALDHRQLKLQAKSEPVASKINQASESKALLYESKINLPDRFYSTDLALRVRAGPAFYHWHERYISLLVFVAGFLTHLLMSALVFVSARKQRRAQAIVKKMTYDLTQSRDRFALAVEGSTDGIWDWNISTNHVYFSPRWKAQLGYSDSEVSDTFSAWADLVHPEDSERAQGEIQKYLLGQIDQYRLEHRLRHKDGTYRWILTRGALLRNEHGQPARLSGSHTDITDWKKSQTELIAAKENALGAVRAKSEFLANMSHEIRTPMNGILGATELLSKAGLDSRQRDLLQTIQVSASGLMSTINDILDFSKIESRRSELTMGDLNIEDLVREVCRVMQVTADQKGIDIKIEVDTQIRSPLIGDSTKVRQILYNLIGNAVKFTDHGSVTVRLISLSEDISSQRIRIEVCDTGIGLSEIARTRIFGAFVQGDSSTSRRYGGTGLGLTISKGLVELMSGQIGLNSVEKQGSTFWFELEFLKAELKVAATATPIAKLNPILADELSRKSGENLIYDFGELAGRSLPQKFSGQESESTPFALPKLSSGFAEVDASRTLIGLTRVRVLIAEDNHINQMVSSKMLEMVGCEVEIAADGLEVIGLLEKKKFDILFLDCQMPEMDGYETAVSIRSSEGKSYQNIPIVAVTANTDLADRKRCIDLGMNEYLVKPVSVETFQSAIHRFLKPAPVSQRVNLSTIHRLTLLPSLFESGLANEVLASFRTSAPGRLENIQAALERSDLKTVKSEAHALKSGAQILGLEVFSDICQKIEDLADDQMIEIYHLCSILGEEFFASVVACEKWLSSSSDTRTQTL